MNVSAAHRVRPPCRKQQVLYALFWLVASASVVLLATYGPTLYAQYLYYTLPDDVRAVCCDVWETDVPVRSIADHPIARTAYWQHPQWDRLESLGQAAVPVLVRLMEDGDMNRAPFLLRSRTPQLDRFLNRF